MSAIDRGFVDANGKRHRFHSKQSMWETFKAACGYNCRTKAGRKFLPSTWNLRTTEGRDQFVKDHVPGRMYLAKNEADAKKGIKLFNHTTGHGVLRMIAQEPVPYLVMQEMLEPPALAKFGVGPGFKVNMRTFIVITCTRERKAEWRMLKAGSYLQYAFGSYKKDMSDANSRSFQAAVDTGYNVDDLVLNGQIPQRGWNKWPSSAIGFLEHLKRRGWTENVDAEWKKIQDIFEKAAEVYDPYMCDARDSRVLNDVNKMFYLIGADILMTGRRDATTHRRYLQPYLIEWNTGPAFGDWGRPKDLEHKVIANLAALRLGGILPTWGWVPMFTQPEYEAINSANFEDEGRVWLTIQRTI